MASAEPRALTEKDVVILRIEGGEPVFVEAIRPENIPG